MSNSQSPILPVPMASPPNSAESPGKPSSRRPRQPRKPRVKMPSPPPVAMRSLWEWATAAQKEQAHQTAACLMEYWLGQATKQEIARRLGLPPLRVWQLSQQAISGMVVGLLNQPKIRGTQNEPAPDPLNDPKQLQKKIKQLETQVHSQERLICWLRELPGVRYEPMPKLTAVTVEPVPEPCAPSSPKNAKPARKAKLRAQSKEA
jgi:hypothetical protein